MLIPQRRKIHLKTIRANKYNNLYKLEMKQMGSQTNTLKHKSIIICNVRYIQKVDFISDVQ